MPASEADPEQYYEQAYGDGSPGPRKDERRDLKLAPHLFEVNIDEVRACIVEQIAVVYASFPV